MTIRKPFAVLPHPLSNIASGNARANRPASHLGLPQHTGMVWQSNGNGNLWVRGQFGNGISAVDFVSLMGANAQTGTTIRVRLGMTQAQVDGTAPYDSGILPLIAPAISRADNIYHSHLELPSVVNAMWWRVDIGSHSGDFLASALVMGTKREPSNFYNRDREIGFEDLGAMEIARNGVVADTPGVVLPTLSFRLEWVSEAEFYEKWVPLFADRGKREVVLWCFDPAANVRRQDKTLLGFMSRDPFMRGGLTPTANQMDFQIRGLAFPKAPPPPPITGFIGSTTANAASGTSIIVPVPAGVQANDLLVAFGASSTTGNEHSVPSGWTGHLTTVGFGLRSLPSYDGSTPSFTFTTTSGAAQAIILMAFRGYDFGAATGISGNAVDPVPPSLTVPANNSIVVQIAATLTAAHAYSMPAGWTNRALVSANRSIEAYERDLLAAAGLLTGTTMTRTAGAGNSRGLAFSLSPKV